ncbi:MAG: hypothetical protein V4513_08335 [Pseudomonadota bacterium]
MVLAILLSSASAPIWAEGAAATGSASTAGTQDPRPSREDAIIVTAPLFRDITPERDLDPDAIESYGVSTIDELLAEVQAELGDEEELPLIIVNGHRISDASEIGALPVEALRNLQVLPRGSAVKAGGKANQRVVSLTLKPTVRSATLTGAEKIATDGEWNSERGEVILTSVHGDTRANLAVRARNDGNLFEIDRGIIQRPASRPYALGGNIIGYPNSAGEIDPLLSAAAGELVTIVPFPTTGTPTIAELAGTANQSAVTDLGAYRTLRPDARNLDVNATFSTQATPWLNATGTIRYNRTKSLSLRGLPGGFFILAPANPASPFDRTVGLAVYGPDPLRYRSRSSSGEGNLTLDAEFGRWTANLQAKHAISDFYSASERPIASTITLADNINPFTTDLGSLIAIKSDRATTHNVDDLLDLTVDGPGPKLPAGDVHLAAEGRIGWSRLHSESTYTLVNPERDFSRNEQSFRGAIDVPLTSRTANFLPQIGNLSANAEYSRIHFSDVGSLNRYSVGLNWDPVPPVSLRGLYTATDAPPPIQSIGDPVIISSNVQVFDPLTGESVDVTQISGGNPFLLPQTTRVRNVGAIFRLLPRLNLQLTAEYFDTERRNFLASLPEASAAIMLAFPDRFIRDSNGVLTTIDLRPVNFDYEREKRLRWGISLSRRITGATPARIAGKPTVRPQSTYIQFTANHTMVFSNEIKIRPGLDTVNLLDGGAIGIGGGRVRHQVDATASITRGGMGARAGLSYRGRSTLLTRIGTETDTVEFSPVTIVNLRLFADVNKVFPHTGKWAKGFRLSLDFLNIANDRQAVRDSSGATPLQYQPGYRDAIGRTIEIELRKVF